MRPLLQKLRTGIDLRDAFAFGGLAMLGYGTHAIYPPAAWILVGGVLFLIGVRR